MAGEETGRVTGTEDKDYNLVWFVVAFLSNALRMDTYSKTPSARLHVLLLDQQRLLADVPDFECE